MATTQNEHNGNGTTRRFSFTFPYIKEDDVKVSVRTSNADVTTLDSTTYTFPSATEIQLSAVTETTFQESTGAPKTGVTLRVFRETDIDNPKAVFYPGSSVRAQDLNDNTLQNLYAEQERQNRAVDRIGGSVMKANLIMEQADIVFEGDTIDDFETTLTVVDPTADQTYRLPNLPAGTYNLVSTGDTDTVTGQMIAGDAINGDRIADDSVDSEHYVAGSIDLEHMSANSVDSDQYVDGSIDRVHLAADVIDGSKIADDVIDSEHYVAGSIDAEHLAPDIIDGTKIADDAINSEHIADGAIDLVHMSANSVDSDQYVDGSIDLIHMSANSVDSDQYVDGSIDRVHLAADVIDGTKIEDAAVNSEHIANGAVDLIHMSANSVDSDQYVDGSIDEVHLADGAVTSTKIADGTIVDADINASAAIAGSKINMSLNQLSDVNVGTPGALQDGQVLAWDDTNSEFALSATAGGGSGLSDVVSDGTPQLGGDLDVNGNKIVTDSNNDNVIIAAHGTGGLQVGDSANNSIITTSGDENLNLDPGGTGDIVLDGVFTINDEGFTYNNTLASPEEVFGLDIENNGDPKLKVSTSGVAETGEFQVFFGDPNAGANARGVRLWAGDTSNKHGRVTIEGRVDNTETVFDVNTSSNDSAALSNKIRFEASGKGSFQSLNVGTFTSQVNKALTVSGDVGLANGNTLSLMASANNNTVQLGHGGTAISYQLNFPNALPTDANRFLRATGNTSPVTLEFAEVDTSSSITTSRIEHAQTLTAGFTVADNSNAALIGDVAIASGQTIQVGLNSVLKII